MGMKVFVTGGTGFIGSHLIDRLLERSDAVRALVRSPHKATGLPERGVEIVSGDLDDVEALERGVAGTEVVYHVAGLIGLKGQRRQVMHVNVDGTDHLLQASVAAGVRRFVYVSSVGVYGLSSTPRPIAEDAPPEGLNAWYDRSGYYTSKVLAEALVRRRAAEHGFEYSIIRPAFVYGERDPITHDAVRLALRLPVAPLPSGGRMRVDFVHGRDVADAILLAGICPEADGETFNVTADEATTLREAVALIRAAAGRPLRILPIPLPPGSLGRRLRAGLYYDLRKAKDILGYRPQIRMRDGMPRVVAAVL
jgi:nucleoside-diphosphate-sugar epimerase